MNKKWQIYETDVEKVQLLKSKYGINGLLATILVNRNIVDEDKIKLFLNPTRNDFHDPFLITDMKIAVDRIINAIKKQEKVTIYGDYDVDGKETPFEAFERINNETCPTKLYKNDRFLCSFSHIFAGGYSAGYYSYKWAEVLSADAFAAFEEAGLDNDEKMVEIGHRFRDTVLALGGSKHPAEVYRMFRGRDATTAALLRHSLGIGEKA